MVNRAFPQIIAGRLELSINITTEIGREELLWRYNKAVESWRATRTKDK